MADAKARINIKEGLIELEGSEIFVKEYLAEFKTLILTSNISNQPQQTSQLVHQSEPKNVEVKVKSLKKAASKRKSAPSVSAERFEIHGSDDTLSLEAFMNQKSPGKANGEKIVTIGYYITELLKLPLFTEGHIEYAYKMLKYPRPTHLHQIMINTKGENDWFEQDSESSTSWKLTRSGEIFVSDTLPKKSDK